MKKVFILICTLVNLSLSAQNKKKAVFIIVDGIPADVIEKLKKTNLDSIAQVGGYARAYVGGERKSYSQTPTISAVGYNSLLTGTWVNKHNVWDNDIKAPNYNYWTIFRFFKQQFPAKKTAVYSTWLDNRTKLVGDNLPQTGHLKTDYHFDGLELDTARFPHDKQSKYINLIDEEVTVAAAKGIRTDAPDLTWVYLEFTDDMGHKHGDSPEFYNAIETMDKQVGKIWQAIKYRQANFKEDWVIYITTDHGRDAKTGKGHGGQSDRERATWIITNAKNLNSNFTQNQPAIVDIMPSIASFMGISLPREQQFEIDGIPLTGKISAISPEATLKDGNIELTWKAIDKKGKAKIWLATTNNFETGGKDTYQLIKEVAVDAEKATIDVSKLPSQFYKIVIEMPYNMLNRWIVLGK
ncbi:MULTISPECIES: alkaline phosphatase family protein [Emticicia]|uniref:alkaline phosphatase family protein n=1 Tax=Emticicia TaxID=312278 RepID=UPI0007D8AC21|nr:MULTISPECIES: alkaline phosphatase family protein [Emticicia]